MPFKNTFDARAKRIQLAILADLTFGKYTEQITAFESVGNPIVGLLEHLRVFFSRGDGDGAGSAKDKIQHRQFENLVVHDKTYGAANTAANDQGVRETYVVTHEYGWAFLRNVFVAAQFTYAFLESVGSHRFWGHRRTNKERYF